MTLSFMTSAAFNQNPSRAKREAERHPLVITEHGRNRYVLMRFEDFETHWRPATSLFEALADTSGSDEAFDPPRLDLGARDPGF